MLVLLRGLLATVLLAALAVPVAVAGQVVLTAYSDDQRPSDVIIVLGETGSVGAPTAVYRARLERAAHLQAAGVAPVIMTIGGRVAGARASEAAIGRAWLLAHGLPRSQVVVVPRGMDSMASLTAAASVMHDLRWRTALLVSDRAQCARVRSMAQAMGIDADVAPAQQGPGSGLTAEYVARETAALLRFQLMSRWTDPGTNPAGTADSTDTAGGTDPMAAAG